ncbi:FG-GAP-like repeat-containing protein [Pseudoxanthomonas sp. LjRoot168]|uniref:reprolysin-like metallopeptidase n=1 Tax=unclassified Pseudoxanthomonas TaxID=2645906 RepID=UPI003ECC7D38
MKLRVGACALMLVLAGCSGESPESGMAGMRGVAASKPTGALPTSLPLARAIGASIANLPDRGALLSFPDKAKPTRQEGAYTWFPTAISEAHAFKGIATGEMTVPSPDGSQVKLRYERHVEEIDGNWTWIGRVVGGDPMQEAIITFGEKAVFGSIPQANGKPALSLQTRNGTVFAVQTDPTKVVSATKGHVDVMIPEARALRSSMGAAVTAAAQVTQNAVAVAQGAPQTAANTIDVAIGYTPEFATANGGASGAATRLVFLIQVGNQAFVNSNVNGYLRVVNAVQVSYTNTNSNQTALSELTGSNGQSAVTVPASLAPLRTARDQYGADIAILVRKFNTPENEGCGIAWLNGANGANTPNQPPITSADAPWGYAVVSDGFDAGTDGKTYYCADETLVHEAAHLMGSAHDRGNSTSAGAFAYSYGYKTTASTGNFYTVMAYGDTGQTAHRIFSTPLKSTCGSAGNLACGVANSEDNARSLNQTIPAVAAFRSTVVPFGNPLNLVYIAKRGGSGRVELHTVTASSVFQTFSSHIATGLAAGTADKAANYLLGDYNGDGVSDLYFVMKSGTASNKTEVHVLSGSSYSSFSLHAATPYGVTGSNNRWIFRLGDYNNDGKPDLYVIDKASAGGKLAVYILSGASSFQTELLARTTITGALPTGTEWVVDLGDFNGDAVPDIFLIGKNGSGGKTEAHILDGATQYQSYLRNIATALGSTGTDNRWDFKIGDYDRDGIPDIYAIDKGSSSGRTDIHVLSGQASYQTFLLHASTAIGAVGIGFESEFELVPGS